MEETILVRIGIFCSFVGVLTLYMITIYVEPEQVAISEVNQEYLGKFVKVSGKVASIREFKKSKLIEIEDKDRIYIYVLNELLPEGLEEGMLITVSGKVQEYKGNLEIVPKKPGDLKVNGLY